MMPAGGFYQEPMKNADNGGKMKKNTVVTGGAGFIGRNVIAALNARGEKNIIIVDGLGRQDKWKNLIGLSYEDFIGIEEFRRRILSHKIDNIKGIIHLGACSSTTEADADFLIDNNYRYTRDLCEWCLHKDVRFVYASTAATYGGGEFGYSDSEENIKRLKPLNMYGYSKHMFDLWALENRLFSRIVGLKYFNVFGPYEDHKEDMRSMVNKAFGQIVDSGKVCLFKSYDPDYKDGEQLRDFIYVKDAVKQTLFFYDTKFSGLFNCGTGKAHSWKDLVSAVFKALRVPVRIEMIEMPETLRKKYQYFTQADLTRLKTVGHYHNTVYALEDAVKDYVSYLRSA